MVTITDSDDTVHHFSRGSVSHYSERKGGGCDLYLVNGPAIHCALTDLLEVLHCSQPALLPEGNAAAPAAKRRGRPSLDRDTAPPVRPAALTAAATFHVEQGAPE